MKEKLGAQLHLRLIPSESLRVEPWLPPSFLFTAKLGNETNVISHPDSKIMKSLEYEFGCSGQIIALLIQN